MMGHAGDANIYCSSLKSQLAFTGHRYKRAALEFYHLRQALADADRDFSHEVSVFDDLVDGTFTFKVERVKVVSLTVFKALLPESLLRADDGYVYPDSTLLYDSFLFDAVLHKCWLTPLRRTVYGTTSDIADLDSTCPKELRNCLHFCLNS